MCSCRGPSPAVRTGGRQRRSAGGASAPLTRAPAIADYRANVTLSNVKKGYTLLCKHALTFVLIPAAAVCVVRAPSPVATPRRTRC